MGCQRGLKGDKAKLGWLCDELAGEWCVKTRSGATLKSYSMHAWLLFGEAVGCLLRREFAGAACLILKRCQRS